MSRHSPSSVAGLSKRLVLALALVMQLVDGTEAHALAFTRVHFDYDVVVTNILNVTTGVNDGSLALTASGGVLGGGATSNLTGNASFTQVIAYQPPGLDSVAGIELDVGGRILGHVDLVARAEESGATAIAEFSGYGYFDFFIDAINRGSDVYLVSFALHYELGSASSVLDDLTEAATSFAWMEIALPVANLQDETVRSAAGFVGGGPGTDLVSKNLAFDLLLLPGTADQLGFRSYFASGRVVSLPEAGTWAFIVSGVAVLGLGSLRRAVLLPS